MKSVADRRARVARVRRAQHLQAVAEASRAEARVADLEASATRRAALRDDLTRGQGTTFAATLAGAGELAGRIDAARTGLAVTIADARATAAALARARLATDIQQRSAEKLQDRAVHALQEMIEERLAATHRLSPKGPRG